MARQRGRDGMKPVVPAAAGQVVVSEDTRSQMVAGAVVVWSFGLVCLAVGGMFSHGDERLILTVGESFTGLRGIRDVFKSTANFTVAANPVGVAHVRFPVAGPETLWEIEELERRGLITAEQLRVASANATFLANDTSLLRRVLRLAWCTAWPGVGSLPADRAPGCRCIANAYLDFVNLTGRPASGVAQVPQAHRDEIGDRVFRCWDQRQMRRSRACGDVCKTQVLGLSIFANVVLFLASSAFLLSVGLRRMQFTEYPIKLALVVLGVLICIPFYVQYPESNAFNLVGIVVCLFYLTVSLHYELGDGFYDPVSGPPLMACLMVNLPLILSAHAIQIGVSGYGRDVWASISFGVCGGVLGLLFQVRFLFVCLLLVDPAGTDTHHGRVLSVFGSGSIGRTRSGTNEVFPPVNTRKCTRYGFSGTQRFLASASGWCLRLHCTCTSSSRTGSGTAHTQETAGGCFCSTV